MREAMRGPGIDPRTWTTAARVESTEWDPALGWVVVVRAYGSGLEQAELTCRQASALAGVGAGEYLPMADGAEVLISLPDASTEDGEPLVVSGLSNEEDSAPTEINGLPINGAITSSTSAEVSPFDTEIKVSPHARREQYAKELVQHALQHVLKADQTEKGVLLGSEDADSSFLKGEDLVDALIEIVDQLVTLITSGTSTAPGSPVAFGGLPAWAVYWTTPPAGKKLQLKQPGVVLSVKVKGE